MTMKSLYIRLPQLLLVVFILSTISSSKLSAIVIGRHAFASAFLHLPIITTSNKSPPSSRRAIIPTTTTHLPSVPPRLRRGLGRHRSSTSHPSFVGRTTARASATSATRLHSLLGLGPAEVGIVLVAGLLVVGPSRILECARCAGELTGKSVGGMENEWTRGIGSIPEEFRRGLEEGEIDARGRKARRMDDVDDDDDDNDELNYDRGRMIGD
ncbi:hypothetical protein ACHAXA_005034 [Cyclostephanos tholiformis]|uniref:Uncharacterized protein n=1 Tax=Cyclostephanos tholiformis TaxID=382380 RepID=A0ABD3SS61_9STRA